VGVGERKARALLARVLLGLRPSLRRLRCRSPGFVRRLRRYSTESDFSRPCTSASAPRLPDADQSAYGLWPDVRPLRFRRVPFRRDVAFDPGEAAATRMTVPHILPSTLMTASASATLSLSRLNPTPHRIAVYASQSPSPTAAQHSLPGGSLHPSRTGLSPAGTRQLLLTHHKRDSGKLLQVFVKS